MVEEYNAGWTAADTKAIGRMIKQTFAECFSMRMVISMKVNGLMTKRMEMELIRILMELGMKVRGRKISKTEKVMNLFYLSK